MATGLANDYYLKALDCYPWYLSDFLEAINYALSYDENHADAHCLFGRFYMEQLSKYSDATYHFEQALAADMNNIPTYYAYIRLTIQTDDHSKARKLLKFAGTIPGVDKSYLKHLEALILEKEGHFKNSKKKLKELLNEETCNWVREYIKKELNRIKEKQKKASKSKKSKKKKKKNKK
ncbi:MAG: hypothetical protein HUJ25_07870 [Crocinitomicaceae bacterium]|nr:hypothetical protein [Crocinitomicaceae bacterium]